MAIPLKYRQVVIRTGAVGFGTYLLFKMIVPSDAQIEKHALHPSEMLPNEEKKPAVRMIELSQQGYSYEAITRIIAKEKQKRYDALYAAQEETSRREAAALEAARPAAKTPGTLSLEAALRSATDAIQGQTQQR